MNAISSDEVCRGQDEASVLHLISSIMFESKSKLVALQGIQHLAEMLHRILDSPSSDLDWS
jgi:hypothetical protein